jgi:hypothetical protein
MQAPETLVKTPTQKTNTKPTQRKTPAAETFEHHLRPSFNVRGRPCDGRVPQGAAEVLGGKLVHNP